jgi:Putative diphthamide synthesis protein
MPGAAVCCATCRAGKRTYTMLMGKPNPAKLANFPEVDVFVMVADAQGLILDSKEYYAPIISAHEALLAFSPGRQWDGTYRLDFESLLVGRVLAVGPLAVARSPMWRRSATWKLVSQARSSEAPGNRSCGGMSLDVGFVGLP